MINKILKMFDSKKHTKKKIETTSEVEIEESATHGRVTLMKTLGIDISDQIQTSHFCPLCKTYSIGLAGLDDTFRSDILRFAKIMRDKPNEIITNTPKCKCGTFTVLTKLIFSATSVSQNIDMHYYFQYQTPYSNSGFEIFGIKPNGDVMKFSEHDKMQIVGFV